MKRKKLYVTIVTAMALLWLVSCSTEDNSNNEDDDNSIVEKEDPGEPIWTIHGMVTGDVPNVTEGNIRAAFIWGTWGTLRVAEDIPIVAGTPFQFDLGIYTMPNEEWLTSSEESSAPQFDAWGFSVDEIDGVPVVRPEILWAKGKLLLYEDLNQNGAFDFLESGDEAIIDKVVGGAFGYEFYYVESEVEHPFISAPEIGNGLLVVSVEEDLYERLPLPLEEEVAIEWDDSADAQRYLCPAINQKHWYDGRHTNEKTCTVMAPSELLSYFPNGILLNVDGHCTEEGVVFEWFDFVIEGSGVCSSTLVHGDYLLSRIPAGETPPSYWPCEVSEENAGWTYVEESQAEVGSPNPFADTTACNAAIGDLFEVDAGL